MTGKKALARVFVRRNRWNSKASTNKSKTLPKTHIKTLACSCFAKPFTAFLLLLLLFYSLETSVKRLDMMYMSNAYSCNSCLERKPGILLLRGHELTFLCFGEEVPLSLNDTSLLLSQPLVKQFLDRRHSIARA